MLANVPPQVADGEVGIVLISGSCCLPGMAPFDEQARRIVEQAVAETGIKAQLTTLPVSKAYFGGVPRSVLDQLSEKLNQTGQLPLPAVLINGAPVSMGVPTLDTIITALRQAVNGSIQKEIPSHE